MTTPNQITRVRFWRWLIRFIGPIVPSRLRADWRQVWEAELQYREEQLTQWDRLTWRNKLNLLRRSASAFWDAMVLQPKRWEDEMMQDLRFGMRMLLKHKDYTIVAVLTLALGIGANTAIFSVVNAVLLRPLPYRDSSRLVLVSHYRTIPGVENTLIEDFQEWRNQASGFEQVAAYTFDTADLIGRNETERLSAGSISADLLETLGVAPALGRGFTQKDCVEGGQPVVILSDRLWRGRFGRDTRILGETLMLEGQKRTVIGVMPPGFRFSVDADLWLPLVINSVGQHQNRLSVIARLKPGLTPEAVQARLSVFLKRRQTSTDEQIRVIGLEEQHVGKIRLALQVLFGAAVFVLLIACANVANLLLARLAVRQKELAIRAAVGAGRLQLARQLMTESLCLALPGGAIGLLWATWGVKLLVALRPAGIARIEESRIDGRVLAFTCTVVVLTGLLIGLFPALQASQVDLAETLKKQVGVRTGRDNSQRVLSALMVAELALSLLLLVGAGLLAKSFLRLLAVPKGFNAEGVLTLTLSPSLSKYPARSSQRSDYFQKLLARVQALPGIQSAGLSSALPLAGPTRRLIGVPIEGRPPYETGKEPAFDTSFVSAAYFQAMGIPLRAGRPFTSKDNAGAPPVVIINETMAQRFFPNENPIGHRLLWQAPRTIVGVVGDASNRGLDSEVFPEIYAPSEQNPTFVGNLVVRAGSSQTDSASLSNLAAAIRNQVRAIDRNEPVNQVVTMDERLSNSIAERRFQMLLFAVSAAIALIIATVGIYGVISYTVSQRTQEIGIRLALGAQAGGVLRLVLFRGMRLALLGVGLGIVAAFALTRVMTSLLFNVSPTDPLTFTLVAVLLVAVAFVANYIPARRATKVDPLIALRSE